MMRLAPFSVNEQQFRMQMQVFDRMRAIEERYRREMKKRRAVLYFIDGVAA